jgi:hypothetical protein
MRNSSMGEFRGRRVSGEECFGEGELRRRSVSGERDRRTAAYRSFRDVNKWSAGAGTRRRVQHMAPFLAKA